MSSHHKEAVSETSTTELEDAGHAESYFNLPDDVVAEVLSYLPLRDRFRLETVCQQWQRCMFLEVKSLVVFLYRKSSDQKYALSIAEVGKMSSVRAEELCAVLQKLRRIKVDLLEIEIEDNFCDRDVFVLLADIARRATEVEVGYHINHYPANLDTFCDIIGPHITYFLLRLRHRCWLPEGNQAILDAMAKMKRLKEVSSNWLELVLTWLNGLPANGLPHFREIELCEGTYDVCQSWQRFKALYGEKIERIAFTDCNLRDEQGHVMGPLREIVPFANLARLHIKLLDYGTLTGLAKDLETVTRTCPLLTSFHLAQKRHQPCLVSVTEVRKLFGAIGKMKKLEHLGLCLKFHCEDLDDVSSQDSLDLFSLLENKCNIVSLEGRVKLTLGSVRREIYRSFNSAVPNVKRLNVICFASELDHFVGLKKLETICLDFVPKETSDAIQDGLIRILRSSPALKCIQVNYKLTKVSEGLIGAIIDVAKLRMEKHVDFVAGISACSESQEAWDVMKHLAPRNLKLILDAE